MANQSTLFTMGKYRSLPSMLKLHIPSEEVFTKEIIIGHPIPARERLIDPMNVVDLVNKTLVESKSGPGVTTEFLDRLNYDVFCIRSCFVYKHRLYIVYHSRVIKKGYGRLQIVSYNHCQSHYDDDPYPDLNIDLHAGRHYEEGWSMVSTLYDEKDALYVLYKGDEINATVVVVKIDLELKKMCDTCAVIWLRGVNKTGSTLVLSKEYGVILVDGLYEVYDIQNFDFNGNSRPPEPLNISYSGRESRSKKSKMELNFQSMLVHSIKGEVYMTCTNPHVAASSNVMCMFHLNSERKCWDELFSFNVPHFRKLSTQLVYQDEIYLLLMPDQAGETYEGSAIQIPYFQDFHRIDLKKQVLIDMDFKVPAHRYFSVIPSYFFI